MDKILLFKCETDTYNLSHMKIGDKQLTLQTWVFVKGMGKSIGSDLPL
jgi:hypothetical protein